MAELAERSAAPANRRDPAPRHGAQRHEALERRPAAAAEQDHARMLNGRAARPGPAQRAAAPAVVQRVTTSHNNAQMAMPVQFSGGFRSKHIAGTDDQRTACMAARAADTREIIPVNTTAPQADWETAVNNDTTQIGNVTEQWITPNMAHYETSRRQGSGLTYDHNAVTSDVSIKLKFFEIAQAPYWSATLWHIG